MFTFLRQGPRLTLGTQKQVGWGTWLRFLLSLNATYGYPTQCREAILREKHPRRHSPCAKRSPHNTPNHERSIIFQIQEYCIKIQYCIVFYNIVFISYIYLGQVNVVEELGIPLEHPLGAEPPRNCWNLVVNNIVIGLFKRKPRFCE